MTAHIEKSNGCLLVVLNFFVLFRLRIAFFVLCRKHFLIFAPNTFCCSIRADDFTICLPHSLWKSQMTFLPLAGESQQAHSLWYLGLLWRCRFLLSLALEELAVPLLHGQEFPALPSPRRLAQLASPPHLLKCNVYKRYC